jgi:hypothetical protein
MAPAEGVSLNIIQRQLGHANLGTTSIYLRGIDPKEIIAAVRARRAPMMPASAGLDSEPPHRERESHGAPASPGRIERDQRAASGLRFADCS